jgi:iron complex outermembrane receptor protein
MPAKGGNMRSTLLAAISIGLCGAAFAQTPAPSERTDEQTLPLAYRIEQPEDTITVLGERRQRLSTPSAGQSLGAEALKERGVTSLDALTIAAPGLHMINDQDPGTNIVSLRGVTTDRLQQAAIAYVIDGVPLADTELFTGRLYDLDRADILRGPQGALFGKNAAGGAIDLTTQSPDSDDGYALAAIGNGNFRKGEAAQSYALGERWRLRTSGSWDAADGWITNRTLNRRVDAEESRNARLRVQGALGGVGVDAKLQWMQDKGGAAWASSNNVTGQFGGRLDGDALIDPIGDFEGRSARTWWHGALKARTDFAGGEASALIARDDYKKRWVEELDYRPGPLTLFGVIPFPEGLQPISQPTDIDATTADLSYVRGDRTRVTVGLFAQDTDRARIDQFGPLLFGANAPRYDTQSLQTAFYAGIRHDAGRYVLDVNLRADRDRRTQSIQDSVSGARLDRQTATFEKVQPRLGASIRLAENVFLYGAYGEGFRTGGFNPRPAPTSIWRSQFDPETTRSVELGLKGRWRDEARFELSLFRAEIEDFQSYTFLDGNSVTLSVDGVTVDGVEVIAASPTLRAGWGDLSAQGAFALANARIDRYVAPDPLLPGATRDYSGNRVPNAPLWTATAGAAFERGFGDRWRMTARADVNATGQTVFELDNVLKSPGKAWLDGRLTFSRHARSFDGPRAGTVSLSLWGKNITDERWAISAFGQGMLPLLAGLGPGGPFDTFTINRGRQWGVELRRDF